MSHSVSRHLRIEIEAYDQTIRRFIPGYDEMLAEAVRAIGAARPPARVIDLGAGTGSLSERVLERYPEARVELWDVDADMVTQARLRLARFGDRASYRLESFDRVAGPVDAIVASLALHHVRELAPKRTLYRSIAAALAPGGIFANADATIPAGEAPSKATYQQWADHMVASGIEEGRAWQHFAEWAGEDRYFSLEEELDAMTDAGLTASCAWRLGPSTVTVGVKAA
ncbi:MAG: class I SAM-dependent methyltransferase [Gemmatimonadales bacterium]